MSTQIVYRKTPFVLQDGTDNTKKTTIDLSNLSASRQLTIPNDAGGVIRTSNRDHYRFFGGLTSSQSVGSTNWFVINFVTSGFIGAADPSGAWDSGISGYVVPLTGYYSISLQVTFNAIGGSDQVRAECGILANDTFLLGERIVSHSSRDGINCNVKSILLNEGNSIRAYGRTSHSNRTLLGLSSSGGPNDGNVLHNYMSIRFLGPN